MNKRLVFFEPGDEQCEIDLHVTNPDCLMSTTVDGYPADPNKPGEIVAEIFLTKDGKCVTSWHDTMYMNDQNANDCAEEIKVRMREIFNEHHRKD